MKVLLLGAGGMLGHALVRQLADQDMVVGDLPDFDITDFKSLNKKIREIKPEILINCAAYTDVDACEANAKLAEKVNGAAIANLAKICSELDIILIHYSTDYVFDGEKKQGVIEDWPAKPINEYGRGKHLGEKNLTAGYDKYYLIRTSGLYGEHGKNFVDSILSAAESKPELKVVNDQFTSTTYTDDLAKATREIIEQRPAFGIYHRTNSGSGSWYDFAKKIKELAGFTAKIVPVSSDDYKRPAQRPKFSKLINTKLKELRPWEEALEEYLSKKMIKL